MQALPLRRLFAPLLALAVLVLPAHATWSIVVLNLKTREVGVASATCIQLYNLRAGTPAIFVGRGAAAVQSSGDPNALGRTIMYNLFDEGVATPEEILEAVSVLPGHDTRQIGIVAFTGDPVTFSAEIIGGDPRGVIGQIGDFQYAIQGNSLVDDYAVVLAAEAAFRNTNGDMGQRLMRSMEAARDLGGDGRCSCDPNRPTICGAPPPSFTKSAHCGYLLIARIGDSNGGCNFVSGCATGQYYLAQNIFGTNAELGDPDPVTQLRQRYNGWRRARRGRADGILSTVEAAQSLPADGVTQTTVTIQLRDIDDMPVPNGGELVTVTTLDGLPSLATVGPMTDLGGGQYAFTLTAGTTTGTDTFVISAPDGNNRRATLYPYLTVRSDPAQGLHAGYDQVSASSAPRVPLVINAPRNGGSKYLIVASLSGTQPGVPTTDFLFPLNPPLFSVLRGGVDDGRMPGTFGALDDNGRAAGAFVTGAGLLTPLIGQRVDWSAVIFAPHGRVATAPVGFDIVP